MDERDLISRLIDTYHQLNIGARIEPGARLEGSVEQGPEIDAIIRTMRDKELQFSEALKERISSVPMAEIFDRSDLPTIGTESSHENTAILIAQFGSAREVTLSLLRGLPDDDWDIAGADGKTIRAHVAELAANDQRQLDRISTLLAGAAPK